MDETLTDTPDDDQEEGPLWVTWPRLIQVLVAMCVVGVLITVPALGDLWSLPYKIVWGIFLGVGSWWIIFIRSMMR